MLCKAHCNCESCVVATPEARNIGYIERISPVATGEGFGGLSPPNKAPSPPKLKRETIQIRRILINLIMSSPTRTNAKPPRQNCKAPLLCFAVLQGGFALACWCVFFRSLYISNKVSIHL